MRNKVQLTSRLNALPALSKDNLRSEWERLFDRPAPEGLRKDLMLRVIAYRMQEVAFGGLKPTLRKRLQHVAKVLASDRHAIIADAPTIKPGTRLVREWRGKPHVVTAIESGFEYAGRRFASLSEIARLITGTRWSGPLFFGLKAKRKEPHG